MDVCVEKLSQSPVGRHGGPGSTAEIDESVFVKRKVSNFLLTNLSRNLSPALELKLEEATELHHHCTHNVIACTLTLVIM